MASSTATVAFLGSMASPEPVTNFGHISFSWYDYILFSAMLLVSIIIGIYFGCFGNKQSSAKEYLMGSKEMKVFPISISLIASHISGLTLLAVPADVHKFGVSYGLLPVCHLFSFICTIFIFLPIFYKLQITSLYEYLELRFNTRTRLLASFLFALQIVLYLPIVIYIPALALSAATGINVHLITPIVCGVCIFYTTIGGLKAVVWTDAIQFTVTIGSLLTVFYMGVQSAGGFGNIFKRSVEGKRFDIPWGIDVTERDSIFAVSVGFSSTWLTLSAIHQSCVQKYLALPTLKQAKWSAFYFAVGMAVVSTFSVITGLIIYAKYYDCDPLSMGLIKKQDQILPFYVLDVAGSIPGLPGLFIAGIFCAALSTLSATLNCLSVTIYEDFFAKLIPKHSEKTTANILKLIVLVTGVACTLFVYVIEKFGSVLQLMVTFNGITSGSTLALFTLGVMFPKVRSKGAFYGAIVGLLGMACIGFTTQYYKGNGMLVYPGKPVTTEGCLNPNANPMDLLNPLKSTISTLMPSDEDINKEVFYLFRVSHYYFTVMGAFISIVSAIIINAFVNKKDEGSLDKDLIWSSVHFALPKDDYNPIKIALEKVDTYKNEKR